MPELPEVEAFTRYIQKHCLHKKINEVHVSDASVLKKITTTTFKKELIGFSFLSAERLGKYILIHIGSHILVMHFGLTGSVFYTTDEEKVRFSRVSFIFKNHGILHWVDPRKFGKLWLISAIDQLKTLKKLGPDPLHITHKQFAALLAHNERKNIKAFLMDQAIIAGIGNEYSDEILFHAGIDPHHKVEDLSTTIRSKLYTYMKSVLTYAVSVQTTGIEHEKEPFSPQFDRSRFKSSYLQAHRHVNMICPKNNNHKLKKAHIAGRTSYYCPKDQA